jgi:antagonist of KipI
MGISASGAADPLSLRVGNLLVGNDPNTPAVEMTLVGGVFEFDDDVVCAVTGSDFSPRLDGKLIPLWQSMLIRGGTKLSFGLTTSGARCYLCIRGGIAVPQVLGSSSTHLQSKLGGLEGRALRSGDLLTIKPSPMIKFIPASFSLEIGRRLLNRDVLRVTPGLQYEFFTSASRNTFTESLYVVTEEANRMGIRLQGEPLHRYAEQDIVTQGVPLGAVQVTPAKQPIILFVEHQTTGGYPLIAAVISADLHRLGQLRPRDRVRFEIVPFETARALLLEQENIISTAFTSQ